MERPAAELYEQVGGRWVPCDTYLVCPTRRVLAKGGLREAARRTTARQTRSTTVATVRVRHVQVARRLGLEQITDFHCQQSRASRACPAFPRLAFVAPSIMSFAHTAGRRHSLSSREVVCHSALPGRPRLVDHVPCPFGNSGPSVVHCYQLCLPICNLLDLRTTCCQQREANDQRRFFRLCAAIAATAACCTSALSPQLCYKVPAFRFRLCKQARESFMIIFPS